MSALRATRYTVAAALFAAGAALAVAHPAQAQKTLRLGTYGIPQSQGNPHLATSRPSIWWWLAEYDTPVYMDNKGNATPGLATAWKAQGEDTWLITLRQGVRYHNDQPFNAAAFAEVLNWLASEAGKKTPVGGELRTMVSARATGPYEVEVKTSEPDPILPQKMGTLRVVEPKAWNDLGAEFSKTPVGTGAFRIRTWGQDRVLGEAFDNGWRKPKVDRLELLALDESTARAQALQSGQLDIALFLGPDDRAGIERAGGKLVDVAIPSAWVLPFITNAPGPHQDVRVRQALNYGVNKQAFIDALFQGRSSIVSQPADSGTKGWQADVKPYAYDPERAKKLLAEAGYPNGLNMVAEVTGTQQALTDVYQYVAQDLKKIGVNLELRVISSQENLRRVLKQTNWEGQMFGMDYGSAPTIDAMRTLNSLHSCRNPNGWYCDQEIMPVINAANREFDLKKREELVARIMRRYNEQAAGLFLHEIRQYDAISAKVRNFNPVNLVINYHEIDLAN